MINDFYCQQKFDWVEIRLYDGWVSSCCQADPNRLTVDQITKRPLGFFNYDEILQERTLMLKNQRISGCNSCWKFEEKGLPSRRTLMKSQDRIYQEIQAQPKYINLVLSNTCNQTCVYCCKNFSHSWLMDIHNNGDYGFVDGPRYQLSDRDKILVKLSQKDLYKVKLPQIIMEQISECAEHAHVMISGGEPFLDNHLVEIVEKVSTAIKISIYSGLAVNKQRLISLCEKLEKIRPDIDIVMSVENTGNLHEFNRFGSSWSSWKENYDIVRSYFEVSCNSVISNVTLFGLPDFIKSYPGLKKKFSILSEPEFLLCNLLDENSKQKIISDLEELAIEQLDPVIKHIKEQPNLKNLSQLRKYLQEFSRRRSLDINVFPKSFQNWVFGNT